MFKDFTVFYWIEKEKTLRKNLILYMTASPHSKVSF